MGSCGSQPTCPGAVPLAQHGQLDGGIGDRLQGAERGGVVSDIQELAKLLSEALDLCVRARTLDQTAEQTEQGGPEWSNFAATRCATPHLWVLDQYDKDLSEWEERARSTLIAKGLAK